MRLPALSGRVLLLVAVLAAALFTTACETYVGVGVGYGYPGAWGGTYGGGGYIGGPVYR